MAAKPVAAAAAVAMICLTATIPNSAGSRCARNSSRMRSRLYLYTGASALRDDVKQPGYFVFAPARLPDGRDRRDQSRLCAARPRAARPADAPAEITGYLRFPETPGWFVSAHDAKGDIWFVRDPQAMAKVRGWGPVAPFYIDQEAPVPAGGLAATRHAVGQAAQRSPRLCPDLVRAGGGAGRRSSLRLGDPRMVSNNLRPAPASL